MTMQIKSYKLNYIVLSLLLLVMVTGTAQADFTEGLVHRWTFNAQQNPLIDDIGGVELVNKGGVIFANGMAIFDGDSNCFLYSEDPRVNSELFGGTKEFTIWVKFEVDSYPTAIVRLIRRSLSGRSDETTTGISLFSSGEVVGNVNVEDGSPESIRYLPYSEQESNTAAISFSPSLFRCYANGTQAVLDLENISIRDIGIFTVGGLVDYKSGNFQFDQVFIGRIDELRIYNRLLTLEELDAIEAIEAIDITDDFFISIVM